MAECLVGGPVRLFGIIAEDEDIRPAGMSVEINENVGSTL